VVSSYTLSALRIIAVCLVVDEGQHQGNLCEGMGFPEICLDRERSTMQEKLQNTSSVHHVLPATTGGWVVRKAGAGPAGRHFRTKREAVQYGRKISREQGTGFVIHGRDGRILSSRQFGSAPRELREERRPESGFGCARGLIVIGPEFDEPLEDFSDYTG